jgi:hypothetical protein
MRWAAFLATLGLATVLASPYATAAESETGPGAPLKDSLSTLDDLQKAISACWTWPPGSAEHGGTVLTFTLSFKRDGEILSGRLNYVNRNLSAEERGKYAAALDDAIRLCSPLPIAPSLGEGIAGQPFVFTLRDTPKE